MGFFSRFNILGPVGAPEPLEDGIAIIATIATLVIMATIGPISLHSLNAPRRAADNF